MPFEPAERRPFTPDDVRSFAPRSSGVFGIFDARGWIYIGESDSIQCALLTELDNAGGTASNERTAFFAYELCAIEVRFARQDRLVLECEPTRNRSSAAAPPPTVRGNILRRSANRGKE